MDALRVAASSLSFVPTRHTGPWAEVRGELLAFVNRRVENLEAAEDIVQDVLERLQRKDPAAVTNIQAWLYRSARNAVIDHYRQLLPDHYRVAVTLVDFDGHTHHAAAQMVGVSTSGMKSRVQRGRKKLAELLDDCCEIETTPGGGIGDYTPRHGTGLC